MQNGRSWPRASGTKDCPPQRAPLEQQILATYWTLLEMEALTALSLCLPVPTVMPWDIGVEPQRLGMATAILKWKHLLTYRWSQTWTLWYIPHVRGSSFPCPHSLLRCNDTRGGHPSSDPLATWMPIGITWVVRTGIHILSRRHTWWSSLRRCYCPPSTCNLLVQRQPPRSAALTRVWLLS